MSEGDREAARLARKDRRQRRRRRAILDAARALLLEGGLPALTMATLAERADTSPSTLYYYLPGRDAVLDAVAADLVEEETVGLMSALDSAEGGVDSLCAVMEARVHMFAEDPARFGLLYLDLVGARLGDDVLSRRIYPASAKVMDLLERRLARDRDTGLLHPDLQPRPFANVGFMAVQGILSLTLGMQRTGGAMRFPVEALLAEALAMVRRAARP